MDGCGAGDGTKAVAAFQLDAGTRMTFTRIPFEDQPEYFGGGEGNRWCSDFPYCPVMIDGEYWVMYKSGDGNTVFRWKGTNFENCRRQPDGFGSMPVNRPYMLGGMWYDGSEGKLYAPLHCEFYDHLTVTLSGAHPGIPFRQIHLASSLDKGSTWQYEGPIVTRDAPGTASPTPSEYSGLHWDGGAGDHCLFVDENGGYLYLYSSHYIHAKTGVDNQQFIRFQVARCAIKDKMMPGKWRKFYDGKWDEPGLGGKASNINAHYVMYNSFLRKYISLSFGNGLSVCSDLDAQDWSPVYRVPGEIWAGGDAWAWHLTDEEMADVHSGGRTLYLYTYWNAMDRPVARKYRIDLSVTAERAAVERLHSNEGFVFQPIASAEPCRACPLESLYESNDPIESRHARRVHCTHPDTRYAGTWTKGIYRRSLETEVRSSGTEGDSIEFAFQGADIHWRAVKGPDCGLADISIDGIHQRTVDCYADPETAETITFLKTGLDPRASHAIRVVVRGERNVLSMGANIRHLLFEHSADSHRASDGFSGLQGKNGWHYLERTEEGFSELTFHAPHWEGSTCANEHTYRNRIGYRNQVVTTGDAVRAWVAPHAGTVRIEGTFRYTDPICFVGDVRPIISINGREIWSSEMPKFAKVESHDLSATIDQGDAIHFTLRGSCHTNVGDVTWDPVITYEGMPDR